MKPGTLCTYKKWAIKDWIYSSPSFFDGENHIQEIHEEDEVVLYLAEFVSEYDLVFHEVIYRDVIGWVMGELKPLDSTSEACQNEG